MVFDDKLIGMHASGRDFRLRVAFRAGWTHRSNLQALEGVKLEPPLREALREEISERVLQRPRASGSFYVVGRVVRKRFRWIGHAPAASRTRSAEWRVRSGPDA